MADELYDACMGNYFPSINTMSMFGLVGGDNTNPIALFNGYRTLFNNGYQPHEIEELRMNNMLGEALNMRIKIHSRDFTECEECNNVHDVDTTCDNCTL